MSRCPQQINWYTRLATTVLAVLGCPAYARAAARGISDFDAFCLGFLFLVVPTYLAMIVVTFFLRSAAGNGRGQRAALRIRSCANLLPITTALAFLVYEYLAKPVLPPSYSDIGFDVTWACILSPLPLALLANYWLPRWPGPYRIASSLWWMALYGAVTGVLATKVFS